jgi:nucleoid-associated protein YgaU
MTTLEKLKIAPEDASNIPPFKVLFNPNTYTISKAVSWKSPGSPGGAVTPAERRKNAPVLEFDGGQSRTLTLELFFDTTEETVDTKVDVRNQTNLILKLTRIVRALDPPRPPVSVISWGTAPPSGSDFPFTGVVTNLSQRFSLFRADGRPVRAILTVVFTEWLDPTKDLKDTDPEITTRLIKRGDTLSSISAEMYSDPTRWRVIAQANQLDDPRQIQVGLRLTIPKIR